MSVAEKVDLLPMKNVIIFSFSVGHETWVLVGAHCSYPVRNYEYKCLHTKNAISPFEKESLGLYKVDLLA